MNIYITLDYELFLNDITGDVDHCLITPTKELLKVLDKHQVKATFFVDMAYIYRLNELRKQYTSLQEDYDKVVQQVKELAENGQKIGLHIHSQWFYSSFNGKEWAIDFDHYKLSDMPEDEACDKFVLCKKMLEEITGCDIESFRAGGYSIQTFQPFARLMKEQGVKRDSSVLYKAKNLSKLHYFDYTSISSSDSYLFKDDVTKMDEKGDFMEYPISTSSFNYITYCQSKVQMQRMKENNNWGNGGDLPSHHRNAFIKNIFNRMIKPIIMPASIDYQSFVYCDRVFKRYLKKGRKDLVIIGHPKNFSPASLTMLDTFLEKNNKTHHFQTI